jgi:CBS domain-containing protein
MEKRCKDFMTPNPSCCVPEDNVVRAAQLMKQEDVGPIPVTENSQSRKLIGIVTDRDIALKVVGEDRIPAEVKVGDVMSRDLVVCKENDSVDQAIEAMAAHQLRRIPIVDSQNNLVGIIAQSDVALRLNDAETTGEVVAEISE